MYSRYLEIIYYRMVRYPLWSLYTTAPSFGAFGGWSGFECSRICSVLSGQSEMFWSAHEEECVDIIDKRFNNFMTTTQTLLYFLCMFKMIQGVLNGAFSFARFLMTKKNVHRPSWRGETLYVINSSNTSRGGYMVINDEEETVPCANK
jgi:hypothetical protein